MRVFYGVQATGNGHITRARAMAAKLKAAGIETTWLFTGRAKDQLFDMEVFGDYQWRQGLTFATRAGRVQYLKTARENSLPTFVRDVRQLDLKGFDAVICDFEPVTAWAAKTQGIKSIGLGHQYAFHYDIPKAKADFSGELVLRHFAPAALGLGVHWHHFNHPILPPIIEVEPPAAAIQVNKVIVYLPFEDVNVVIDLLKGFDRYQFAIYSPVQPDQPVSANHIQVNKLSRDGFKQDFSDAAAVICNAGFELSSEALHAGKKILVKPLHGQMEQASNALALKQLGLGQVMQHLDTQAIESWLGLAPAAPVNYPDTAQAIVDWLLQGELRVNQAWINGLWTNCAA